MSLDRSDLIHHLARFARALRERGVPASLSDEADGLAALILIDLGDRDEVRLALRTGLKIRPRDAAVFEELFERLWNANAAALASQPAPRLPHQTHGPSAPRSAPRPVGWPAGLSTTPDVTPTGDEPGYSRAAALRRKPFEELAPSGDRRYEPTARAMAAALPHIDRLLPAHNLESLERLLPLLTS